MKKFNTFFSTLVMKQLLHFWRLLEGP